MSGMGGGLSKFAPAYLRNRYKVLFYTILSVLLVPLDPAEHRKDERNCNQHDSRAPEYSHYPAAR